MLLVKYFELFYLLTCTNEKPELMRQKITEICERRSVGNLYHKKLNYAYAEVGNLKTFSTSSEPGFLTPIIANNRD